MLSTCVGQRFKAYWNCVVTDWVSRRSGRRSRRPRSAMHRQMKSANCIQDLHNNDLTMYTSSLIRCWYHNPRSLFSVCLEYWYSLHPSPFFSVDMHGRVRSAIAADNWSGYNFHHLQTEASKFKATWSNQSVVFSNASPVILLPNSVLHGIHVRLRQTANSVENI